MKDLFREPMPSIKNEFSDKAKIVLYEGDCAKALKKIPGKTFKLIITSPPYNVGKEYESVVSLEKYLDTIKPTIEELARILSDAGSICWQVGNFVDKFEVFPLDIYYYPYFKNLGLHLRNRIIWHFEHGLHATKRFSGRYEVILWFTKTDDYIFNLDDIRVPSKYPGKTHFKGPNRGLPSGNPLGKNPSDFWETIKRDWENEIWNIPNVKANHPEKTIHPCQFPIELIERCVLALTNEGDWVLDPYAGVGSTMIASVRHGRRTMGCEKESEYVNIAKKRLQEFYDDRLKIRPLGKPVYQPTGHEKVCQVPFTWHADGGKR